MVLNEKGVILFPTSKQHRDMKAEGISYEDNYKGNALAAMVRRDAIEIRFHQDFKDSTVSRMIKELLARPELSGLASANVTYQGRQLSIR